MSTYYSIVCDKCKEEAAFVCRNFPAQWGWMGGADNEVPAFIEKHEECIEHLRIISEHDSRYEEYAEFEVTPNAIGQRGAACGASAAPTGCASNDGSGE